MGFFGRLLEPDIERHLLMSEGEFVIDEVRKHWAATFWWHMLMAASIPFFLLMIPAGNLFWLPLAVGLVLLGMGIWKAHVAWMDRFVITNMRVFRVHGVLNQNLATMPMTRILDISLSQSLLGQLLNYGHFVFESAAQDQGLREIRYVGQPAQRDLTIQRVIQRAGLRVKMPVIKADESEDGFPHG